MSPTQTTTTQTTISGKPRIRKGSKPYLFHVESRTRPGVFHVTDAYHMTCTCEAGRARRLCWHLRLAIRFYDWWTCEQEWARQEHEKARVPAVAPALQLPAPSRPDETGMRALQAAFGE